MAAETEAKEALRAYVKKHRIDELIKELLEGLLKETPDMKPKEHWANMLRLEQFTREGEESVEHGKGLDIRSTIPTRELHSLLEAAKRITAEIVPQQVVRLIISETIRLLQCDCVYLFVYDSRSNMMVLQASNLDAPIRVKLGEGLASQVFTMRKAVNTSDCDFDRAIDKLTGYSSKSVLAVPIIDFEGKCQGVLQAVNKVNMLGDELGSSIDMPVFTGVDEAILEILAQPVSTALHRADVLQTIAVSADRGKALLGMIRSLSQNLGQQSVILAISMQAKKMAQASHCTVFLVDEGMQQLWSIASDSGEEMRVPMTTGIAGKCATFGIVVIEDGYADSRFEQETDKTRPFKALSILAVPVFRQQLVPNGERQVLAVIKLVNKMGGDGEVRSFNQKDIKGMETFALLLSSKLEGFTIGQSERRSSVEQTEVIHGLRHCPGIGSPNASQYFAELTGSPRLDLLKPPGPGSPKAPGSPYGMFRTLSDRRSVISALDAGVIFEEDERAQEQSESDKSDEQ